MTCEITTGINTPVESSVSLEKIEDISVSLVFEGEKTVSLVEQPDTLIEAEAPFEVIALLELYSGCPGDFPLDIELGPDFYLKEALFSFNDESVLIDNIPAGSIIKGYGVYVYERFSDPVAKISIGEDSNPERIMLESENQPGREASFFVDWEERFPEATAIKVFIGSNGDSGRGKATILYKVQI